MEKRTCECSICLEPYETPRGLPCLHTFCTKCIQWHIDNSRTGEKFACPLCRALTTPPDISKPSSTWATTFPIANVVCDLMEVLHIKNEQIKSSDADCCEMCVSKNITTDTIAFCKTCQQNLCQSCSERHSIESPAHKIMLDKDSLDLPQQEHRIPKCPAHKSSALELFCTKCDCFICVPCTYGEHASCSKKFGVVKAIGVLVEERRSSDITQVEKLKYGRDEMSRLLEKIVIKQENLVESKKENEAKIDKIVDDLIASLEKKRAKSKASLEQIFNAERQCLGNISFVSQRRLAGLNRRITTLETNLEINNNFEYLSESKKTTEAVYTLLPSDLKTNLAFSVDPEFRLISKKMDRVDIGNAFIASDEDIEKPPWCKFETPQKLVVKVYSADIITSKVDGIVNETDCKLTHSGELSQRITHAAGPAISAAKKKVLGSRDGVDQLELADVFITKAGKLDFPYILHAVVPDHAKMKEMNMRGGRDLENFISQTVSNSLFVANSLRLQSVALPSFCFSLDKAKSCANGYLRGVLEFSVNCCNHSRNSLREVHFVDSKLLATRHIQARFQRYLDVIYNIAT